MKTKNNKNIFGSLFWRIEKTLKRHIFKEERIIFKKQNRMMFKK